jgi:hypothetical protein
MTAARILGRLLPSTWEMLKRDRLPQTRHLSCGLSVTAVALGAQDGVLQTNCIEGLKLPTSVRRYVLHERTSAEPATHCSDEPQDCTPRVVLQVSLYKAGYQIVSDSRPFGS